MIFLIILLVIVAVVAALRMRRVLSDRASEKSADFPAVQAQPPGTRNLDEETAARPEIDGAALAAARAKVSQAVPDEVLQDVLLDATPQQAAHLFAGVSQEVMAGAIGQQTTGVHIKGQAGADDLAKLNNLGSAVDDLDIWNFGDDKQK